MRNIRRRAAGAALLALTLVAGACGSGGGSKSSSGTGSGAGGETSKSTGAGAAGAKGTVVVGSANFGEQLLLGNMYADVLEDAGFTVKRKLNLGSREVTQPALESGEIDVMPEYAATLLEFVNKGAGEATGDVDAVVSKLKSRLADKKLTVLQPSQATDGNVFAMQAAKASQLGVKTLSDLKGKADQLVLGGPPECPQRPFCQKGLESTYGLTFKSFKPLDAGGPITKEALAKGDVDVALLFSSDPAIQIRNFTVLEDDKNLQSADNIIPEVRQDAVVAALSTALNKVSSTLTTDDLIGLNKKVDVDKEDPDKVAKAYLQEKGVIAK